MIEVCVGLQKETRECNSKKMIQEMKKQYIFKTKESWRKGKGLTIKCGPIVTDNERKNLSW